MALIEYEFFIEDGKGGESIFAIWTAATVDWTDLQTAARDLMPLLRNIITGGVVGCRASKEMDFSALYASFPSLRIPDADSDIEEGAVLVFAADQDKRDYIVRLPTFDEDLIIPNSVEIDLEDVRVIALADAIANGSTYVTFDEYALDTLHEGKEKFKASKRRGKGRWVY